MDPKTLTDEIFFADSDLDLAQARRRLEDGLDGADDGELFLERRTSESLAFDDGQLRTANHDVSQGFGMRAVAGEFAAYAHGGDLTDAALARAAETAREAGKGRGGELADGPSPVNRRLYGHEDPTQTPGFASKVGVLEQIDAYLRAKDPAVVQVSASISAELQAVKILRADGQEASDLRPPVRVNVQVTGQRGARMETGSDGRGGPVPHARRPVDSASPESAAEAHRQALAKREAGPAPAWGAPGR